MKYPLRILLLLAIAMICIVATPSPSLVHRLPQTQGQMVVLNVRVTDVSGRSVADLPQSSFQVTEDGVPQQIQVFLNRDLPLTYGLVIDNSGSLHEYIKKVLEASVRIVNSNTDADETFIVRFVDSDKIETVQDVTSNKKLLIDGLESLYIEAGQTAVIDAVYLSAQRLAHLKSANPRRKVLVLVTDGEDRNSYYREKDLLKLLNTYESQIYIVGLTEVVKPDERDKALRLLQRLAGETGGRLFLPSSPRELDRIADEIINDIRTQYVIGYVPTSSSKDFQKVQVSIADNPNQEKRIAVSWVGYSTKNK